MRVPVFALLLTCCSGDPDGVAQNGSGGSAGAELVPPPDIVVPSLSNGPVTIRARAVKGSDDAEDTVSATIAN